MQPLSLPLDMSSPSMQHPCNIRATSPLTNHPLTLMPNTPRLPYLTLLTLISFAESRVRSRFRIQIQIQTCSKNNLHNLRVRSCIFFLGGEGGGRGLSSKHLCFLWLRKALGLRSRERKNDNNPTEGTLRSLHFHGERRTTR